MKFSIQLPTCTEGLVNPVPFVAPEEFVRMAQEAERLGYDAIWGNDHVTPASYAKRKWPEPPNFYEVLVTLATVGARTTRIRLGDRGAGAAAAGPGAAGQTGEHPGPFHPAAG